MGIEGILATHTAGAHCATTFTLLKAGFADLKEETQPFTCDSCTTGALSSTVNMILSTNWSGC